MTPMNIQQRIKQLRLPIIQSPMFLISQPEMLIECTKQGIIGSLPSQNARTHDILDQWLGNIKSELSENDLWAINIITHSSFARSHQDREIIVKHQVPIVISALGSPKPLVKQVHEYGGVVFADVINKQHAIKAIEAGVDGLILICHGAGGHTGKFSPFAFINEIRQIFDGVIVLGGAISTGSDVLAARAMGADLAYMGTRFIASQECNAPEDYKQMIVECDSSQIIMSNKITGVDANWLAPSLEKTQQKNTLSTIIDKIFAWSYHNILKKYFNSKVNFKKLDSDKFAKRWRDIYSAGQGVASIHSIHPVKELIITIEKEYQEAKLRI